MTDASELGAIGPVDFPFAEAELLVSRLRVAAADVKGQIGRRNALAKHAEVDWKGQFAQRFGMKMHVCIGDAGKIASKLEELAAKIELLIAYVHAEEKRRAKAREWKHKHDDWEKHKDDIGNQITHLGGLLGDGEPKPDVGPPLPPPNFPIELDTCGARE
jgi:hypothetical protein